MVLQKVVEEKHVKVTDTLIDDNNAIIQVGAPRESLRLLIPRDRGLFASLPCMWRGLGSGPCERRGGAGGADLG